MERNNATNAKHFALHAKNGTSREENQVLKEITNVKNIKESNLVELHKV